MKQEQPTTFEHASQVASRKRDTTPLQSKPQRSLRGTAPQWQWRRRLGGLRSAREAGQIIPLAVIILPFLVLFTLLVIEVAERWLEVAMVEDALQQATRSAVQHLDYAAFARGEIELRGGAACHSVTVAQAQGTACAAILEVAAELFRTNLTSVRGLVASPASVTAQVRWTVLPTGGSCTYSNGVNVPTETTPLICAEVRPTMKGLVGWGTYAPLIIAADRLEPVTPLIY